MKVVSTDANAELEKAIDYLDMSTPSAFDDELNMLNSKRRSDRRSARHSILHLLGLAAFTCLVGAAGGIPKSRRARHKKSILYIASVFDTLNKHRIEWAPIVHKEAIRLGWQGHWEAKWRDKLM